ncbi:oligosaccharide flippase family protein [Vibrio coralliirubri]|uniref:lipopolysaccharide biosynthesis protein n=1 Tax=Vibrio coralliirubri TaxID=1516159 RepID=UPI0022842D07|nr:oligosaccharide flippase family protein [Vibrio coralliirubri]MCY9864450.1 oligosaccharide flippase family protein [Vibrio coralliirubri]
MLVGIRDGRLQKALLSTLAMFCNKFFQVFVTVFTMPILLDYLGVNEFGVYISLQTFFLWLLFDNGISEAAKNFLVEALINNNEQYIRKIVSSSVFVLLFFSTVVVGCAYIAFDIVFPLGVIKLQTLNIILIIVWLYIPIRVVREISTALQKGYIYSNYLNISALVNLIVVVIGVEKNYSLDFFILGSISSIFLSHVVCFFHLIFNSSRSFLPSYKEVDIKLVREMLPVSVNYFMIGIFLMLINNVDLVIINKYLGSDQAAEFSFIFRLVVYGATFASFFSYPLWPAITDSIKRNDGVWRKKAVKKLILFSLLYSLLVSLSLSLFGSFLVSFWSSNLISISYMLCFILSVYLFVKINTNVISTVLKAYGVVKQQTIPTILEALLHITLCIFLGDKYGLEGYAIGILLSAFFGRSLYLLYLFFKVEMSWKRR